MDYKQAFCSVVVAAYFIWVAKSWWNTDRDALAFQRKVWPVIYAALVLGLVYSYGLLRGSSAVIEEIRKSMPTGTTIVTPGAPVVTAAGHSKLEEAQVPPWVFFYLGVLATEIFMAVNMPDRKRTHSHASVKNHDEP